MKIVIDFRKYDGVVGGVELGVIQVAKRASLKGHSIFVLPKESRLEEVEKIFDGCPNVSCIPLPVESHVMSGRNARLDAGRIQDIAAEKGADVIHFPYNWSFPTRKKAPTVLTIHDLIPLTFREAMDLLTNLFRYKPGMKKAARLNDKLATVSEFSKGEIVKHLGVPPEKVSVIPNGLRELAPHDPQLEAELRARLDVPGRFILNVGGIHERKNVPRLIHAFARLVRETSYPGKLVITGSTSGAPYQEKMKRSCDAAVSETGMGDRVVFTGFIPDNELDTLFRVADLLVYPSLYEGFGIPVLEAMQAGLPVITSNVTALPETAGGAALLVDPRSVEDMTGAMKRLLEDADLREILRRKGLQRASHFTWDRTTESYLELYSELAGKKQSRQ